MTRITEAMMRLRFCEKSMPASTSIRIPSEAMIPKSRIEIPPITCTGMERIVAPTTGRNDITMAITAAPPMTQTLKTLVIAMTPMFSP
jgi:virulence-associated protein VagC